MNDGRLGSITDMIAESTKTVPDKMEDPKRRMITGVDLRGDMQRISQKNNDPGGVQLLKETDGVGGLTSSACRR